MTRRDPEATRRYKHQWYLDHKAPRTTWPMWCVVCSAEFVALKPWALYCRAACKSKAQRGRKR